MLLNFDDVGPGPVVVLLHGFPLDHTMWEYQKGSIGAQYRVITPDLRGHGKTAAPDGIYPIDDMADDVLETLDALKITEPFVLGGLSMGGYVALSIAVRQPKRIRGLILMDTRATADTAETARVREDLARQVEISGSVESVVEAMLPVLFAPATRARHADLIARVGDRMFQTNPRGVVGTLRGLARRPDRTGDLGRITVPSLVLVGEDDAITPPDASRKLAEAVPGARFVTIPDAGHLAPLENPTASNAAILQFLGELA
jgi:pimeloyl-ACP methyl ester carboxylesterase